MWCVRYIDMGDERITANPRQNGSETGSIDIVDEIAAGYRLSQ
jgi:hypothetical protein